MPKITTTLFGELVLLPYASETPTKEYLQWVTYINTAIDGTESRHQRRSFPRQEFNYNVPLSYLKKHEPMAAFYGAIRDDWAIPVWPEIQDIGTVTGGATFITCETTAYSFRDDSLAMIYVSSDDYEIVEIQTVTGIGLNLYGTGVQSRINARILPVRKCIIDGNVGNGVTGFENAESIKFRVSDDDNAAITDTTTPVQENETDVYFDLNVKNGRHAKRSMIKKQIMTDFKVGSFSQMTNWTNTRQGAHISRLLDGPEEIHDFKMFLQRRSGRFEPFFYPSFENDLLLVPDSLLDDIILDRIVAVSNSYIDFSSNRNKICFNTNGGYVIATIESMFQQSDTRVVLIFSETLNLDVNDVLSISYLGYHRLNSDRVELKWIGGGVVEVTIPILEIEPWTYTPPVIE